MAAPGELIFGAGTLSYADDAEFVRNFVQPDQGKPGKIKNSVFNCSSKDRSASPSGLSVTRGHLILDSVKHIDEYRKVHAVGDKMPGLVKVTIAQVRLAAAAIDVGEPEGDLTLTQFREGEHAWADDHHVLSCPGCAQKRELARAAAANKFLIQMI